MKTTMYLIRHASAEAGFAQRACLEEAHNPPLGKLGVRQAELTRDFLAVRPIDTCYTSPLRRAVQTASIIAAPHGLSPIPLDELAEGEVSIAGDAPSVGYRADAYPRFVGRSNGYADLYSDMQSRVTGALEGLFARHAGRTLLVVAHYDVNRVYLAGLLGLNPAEAGQVQLDNCGISVVVREGAATNVSTLNASFHLQGVAA